jgi:nitroreductase
MELFEAIRIRRSVRNFHPKAVEKEKLEQILEAANQAPSAGDTQGYEIVVVEEGFHLEQLWKALLGQTFTKPAPLALVFCANEKRSAAGYGARGKDLYCLQDATISASYAQLSATALGLSTVWVGAFKEEEVRKTLEAPDHIRPVVILPLGYSAEEPGRTSRRALSDIVHRDTF